MVLACCFWASVRFRACIIRWRIAPLRASTSLPVFRLGRGCRSGRRLRERHSGGHRRDCREFHYLVFHDWCYLSIPTLKRPA